VKIQLTLSHVIVYHIYRLKTFGVDIVFSVDLKKGHVESRKHCLFACLWFQLILSCDIIRYVMYTNGLYCIVIVSCDAVFLYCCCRVSALCGILLYCIVLYCVVLCCIVLYCIVLYCCQCVLYCIVLCSRIVLYARSCLLCQLLILIPSAFVVKCDHDNIKYAYLLPNNVYDISYAIKRAKFVDGLASLSCMEVM